MFDDLLRRLREIAEQQLVPIELLLDEEGYFDRACPAPECGAAFKVLFADWREKVPDQRAWCPVCGELEDPREFNTPDQKRSIEEQALAHLSGQLDDAFSQARMPTIKDGFLSMTWSYKPGARPLLVPAAAAPVMTQHAACEVCDCHYASIGAAFFCPACGHNSAPITFAAAMATVRAAMDLVDRLGEIVEDRDQAADIARHMAEASLVRVWSSFQRFAEATYASTPQGKANPPRRNAFQNLAESDRLWKAAIGKTYADLLAAGEHRDLVRLVQARHVLAHPDGMVDADYIAKSGDTRYAIGQRLVVTTTDVRRLVELTEKLGTGL